MARFRIEWKSGKVIEVEQSDCHTVEQMAGCMFGRGVDFESFGTKITLIEPESESSSTTSTGEPPAAGTVKKEDHAVPPPLPTPTVKPSPVLPSKPSHAKK